MTEVQEGIQTINICPQSCDGRHAVNRRPRSNRWSLRFRILVLLVGFSPLLSAETRQLVSQGKSDYVILVPAKAAAPELFAASELQRYLEKMTGAKLPLVVDNRWEKGRFVSVGMTAPCALGACAPKARYADDDGFALRARGDDLFLAGSSPRGSLFAVYALLESLGARWFAPGFLYYRGFSEQVPKLDSVGFDAALNQVEQPDFKLRGEYPEHYYASGPDDVVALIDWAAKNRINLIGFRQNEFSDIWYRIIGPECVRRGLLFASTGHGYQRFLPRDRYFREHPEWFAEVGGRRSDRYFDQFCTTNQDALKTFTDNIRDFVRAFPGLYSISSMPNDSPRWCECATCKAEGISAKDRLFQMTQLISRTVYEANPAVKVEASIGVAYFGVGAEEMVTSPVPNLAYRSGVLRRCLRHAWSDPTCEVNEPQYRSAAAALKKAAEAGGEVIWTSRYSSFREQSLPGILYPSQMAAELRDLKQIGGAGVLYCYATIPDWVPYELKHYLYARLLWDASQSEQAVMADYFRVRFSGSRGEMEAFYANLRSAMERYDHPGGGYRRENRFGLYPVDKFEQASRELATAGEQLEKALRSNPDRDQKQLIWLLKQSLPYAADKLEMDRLEQAGKTAEAAALAARIMDHIEQWDGYGIFYDSVFLRRSVEYRFARPGAGNQQIKKRPWSWIRAYEFEESAARPRRGGEQPD